MIKNYFGCMLSKRKVDMFLGNPLLIKISITYNGSYEILRMGRERDTQRTLKNEIYN